MALHHSYDRVHTEYGAPRSQNTATRARAEERETNTTPRRQSFLSPLARSTATSTTTACHVRGLTVSLTSHRRSGCCGTLWSRWLTARWLCRCLKLQCSSLGAVWLGAAPTSCSSTASARASCGASPRPGSAGGCQASHSDAGDGLIRGPREERCSHVGRDALHRVADASVLGA